VHALAADRRILDLHAGVGRRQRVAEHGHRVCGKHASLAEAREPHDDHLELPPAVLRPRVHDATDLLAMAIVDLQTEQVSPGHSFHTALIERGRDPTHRVATPIRLAWIQA
jgi:hypothetical protein